jgi:zinc protease
MHGLLDLPFTQSVLANGLRVVIHPDRTQPLIAACVAYHVGSAREEPRRSGFAHLFEHMLFQGSQHVPDNDHFRLITAAGGTLNGTTSVDRTLYFETVPSNQLELVLWLESDRMGFLLPALTQEKLENQRDVVKNERRQNYDDRPYGRVDEALFAALYPPEHPYHRIPIGSMEDLDAASLADVHAFFRRWYGPNNATLVLGGDVDPDAALARVEHWFGSIPRGAAVAAQPPHASRLARSVRTVLEDTVTAPQLDLAWPSVPRYATDEPALDMLAMVLSENKASVLDRALTVDALRARFVTAGSRSMELAGHFTIGARAAPGVGLEQLEQEIDAALAALGRRGIDAAQLQRMQNRAAARHFERMELLAQRVHALALHDLFVRDPGLTARELELHLAVTPQDVERVLATYLLERPRACIATVPGARRAHVAPAPSPASAHERDAAPAPAVGSDRERSRVPPPGPRPAFRTPPIWHAGWSCGWRVLGSRRRRVPMSTLLVAVPGGRVHETPATLGLASLTAELLNEGTRSLSTTELTDAIDHLGATLEVHSDDDETTLRLTALDQHLAPAVELLGTVLLEPRFAPRDFERLRAQRLAAIAARADDARRLAHDAWQGLMYGADSVLGQPALGTQASIAALCVEDVRRAWERAATRPGTRLALVGDLDGERARALFSAVEARWCVAAGPEPAAEPAPPPAAARSFLLDVPGAAQSEVRVGHMSVSSRDPDFFPLGVLNYVLGGAFSSRINLNLREDKGYTYGARSSVRGGLRPGPFTVASAVHTQHTAAAVREILRELERILDGPSEAELAFARDALSQQLVTQLESARALLGVLDTIAKLGWPDDYLEQRLATLARLTCADLAHVARRHIHPGTACVLIVGDRARVAPHLAELGLGPPVEL